MKLTKDELQFLYYSILSTYQTDEENEQELLKQIVDKVKKRMTKDGL